MTEPEPTPAADEPPFSVMDADRREATDRDIPAGSGDVVLRESRVPGDLDPTDTTSDDHTPRSISGADIREIDTSDLIEVERFLGLATPTGPTDAEPEAQVPVADPVAAFYAARWEPEEGMADRRYRGRRREKILAPRFWAAVLAALAAVIGGLLYGGLSRPPSPGAGSPAPTESASASLPFIAVGPGGSATSAPSTTPTAQPGPPAPTTPPSSVPLPPFAPLTIEAESGTVGGSAEAVRNNRASGKHIVARLGTWGSGAAGTLAIVTGVVPSAGTYAMTIAYQHSDGEPIRTAIITVNSVALAPTTFTASSGTCCYTLTIELTLRVGTNTIVFSNPTGRAPSLDKLVITRPD
ncbi:MAG: hypothetical protein ACM30G_03635 [Micromonosporaceae bacterium]